MDDELAKRRESKRSWQPRRSGTSIADAPINVRSNDECQCGCSWWIAVPTSDHEHPMVVLEGGRITGYAMKFKCAGCGAPYTYTQNGR